MEQTVQGGRAVAQYVQEQDGNARLSSTGSKVCSFNQTNNNNDTCPAYCSSFYISGGRSI